MSRSVFATAGCKVFKAIGVGRSLERSTRPATKSSLQDFSAPVAAATYNASQIFCNRAEPVAPHAPYVQRVRVGSLPQNLRGFVPHSADPFRAFHAAHQLLLQDHGGAEVRKNRRQRLASYQYVLRLNVSVQDAMLAERTQGLEQIRDEEALSSTPDAFNRLFS